MNSSQKSHIVQVYSDKLYDAWLRGWSGKSLSNMSHNVGA